MALPVQIASNSVSVAALTNAKAFTSNVTAGNLIFVVVANKSGNFPNTVTDNQGNAYTFWDLQQSGVAACATTWFAVAGSTGALTVTATWGGNETSDMIIAEYAKSGGVPALDNNQSITNATTAATTLGTGNITTTLSSDLLISWGYDGNLDGSPWTDTAGGTLEQTTHNTAGASLALFDRTSGAPGVQNDSLTATTGVVGNNLIVGIIAFKNVAGAAPAPSISCNNPPMGNVGLAYSHAFTASGGTPPYVSFAITAGALPPGVTLNTTTGVAAGTPTTAGTYTFTVQVTDSGAQTAQVSCTIVISSQSAGPSFVSFAADAEFFASGPPSVFTANGALYVVQQTIGSGGGNINGTAVFKSTDNGNTWAELDAANAPTSAVGWPVFDTANNRLLFGLITVTAPVTQQALFLKAFSFATETWGANFATGGPVGENPVQFTFVRPDNSVVVIYDFGAGLNPGGTTRLRAAIWNGAAWSSSIDLGAAILPLVPGGNVAVSSAVAAMDTTGNVHVAFNDSNRSVFMYQQLTGSALGSSHQFTETFQVQRPAWANMLVLGNAVLISGVTNNANNTFFIGAGLSAPVWSSVTPSNIQPATAIRQPGPVATDGTNLYWMLDFTSPESSTVDAYKLARSKDGGHTWAVLSETAVSPFFYDFGASTLAPSADPSTANNSPVLAVLKPAGTLTAYGFCNVAHTAAGGVFGYFMNLDPFSTTPTQFEISLLGVKRFAAAPPLECVEMPTKPIIKRVM